MATLFQLQEGLVKASESGNDEHVSILSDAIREHPTYQNQGKEALSQGFKGLSGDERKKAIRNSTAQAMGIKPSDLDADRGMGGIGRLQFKALPTQKDKLNFLEKSYGRENLNVVNIGGSDEFLYRDEAETGGKWRRVDEEGVSLADFTTDVFSVAPEVGGAVLGGIKGAAAGSAIAPGAGTLVGGVLGAAAGGFGGAVTGDVAARASTGQDLQVMEAAGRRLGEVPRNIAYDAAFLGAGKLATKGFGKGTSTAVSESAERLGAEDLLTAGQRSSKDSALRESEVLGEIGEGSMFTRGLSKQLGAQREFVQGKVDARSSSKVNFEKAFENYSNRLNASNSKLVDQARVADAKLGQALKKSTEFRAQRVGANQEISDVATGERLMKTLKPELDDAIARKNEAFAERDRVAEQFGKKIEVGELQKSINKGLAKRGVAKESRINALLSSEEALGQVVKEGEVLTLPRLQTIIGDIDSSLPQKGSGFTGPQRDAIQVSRELKKLRDKALAASDQVVQDSWENADKVFKEDFGRFERGTLSSMLDREKLASGDGWPFKKTPTEVTSMAVSDPNAAKELLDATKNSPAVRSALKKAVIHKATSGTGKIKISPDSIRAIWGKSDAAKRIQYIDELNRFIDSSKISPSKFDAQKINELFGAGSPKGKREAMKAVKERAIAEKERSDLIANGLIKKVANGTIEPPENAYQFAEDMLNKSVSVGDAQSFMSRLTETERDALGAEVFGELVRRARDGDKLMSKASMNRVLGGKSSRNKIDAVSGEGTTQTLEDLATLYESASVKASNKGAKARVGFSGLLNPFFVISNLGEGVFSRVFAAAHGSKILRNALTDNPEADRALQEMMGKLLGTSQGVSALMKEAEKDPNLQELLNNVGQG